MVLVSELTGSPLDRLRRVDHPPGFEVIPLTPAEFLSLLEKRNPVALEAVGKEVFLRDDFNLEKLRKERRNKPPSSTIASFVIEAGMPPA